MAKETDLEYVVRRLNDWKGMWVRISLESGVSYSAVRSIANGSNINPTLKTVNRLAKYLGMKSK